MVDLTLVVYDILLSTLKNSSKGNFSTRKSRYLCHHLFHSFDPVRHQVFVSFYTRFSTKTTTISSRYERDRFRKLPVNHCLGLGQKLLLLLSLKLLQTVFCFHPSSCHTTQNFVTFYQNNLPPSNLYNRP